MTVALSWMGRALWFWLLAPFVLGQDIDTLKTRLAIAKGADRMAILHQLAEAFELSSPRDAVRYGEEGLALARSLEDSTAIADFLGGLGYNYMNLGDYEKALRFQLDALAMREEAGDDKNAAKSLNNIGIVYYYLGDSEEALTYHFRAMALREKHQNRAGLAITLNNIGLVYMAAEEYGQAIDYFQRSLTIREELADKIGATRVLSNIGAALEKMARHEEALSYQHRARKLAEAIGFENGIAYAAYNIGTVYQALNRLDEAVENHDAAYRYYQRIDDLNGQALALTEIGRIHALRGRNEEALRVLNQVVVLADELQSPARLKDAHEALATIQERRGRYAEALDHYRSYMQQREIIANEETRQRMSELSIRYDTATKAKEIEILKAGNAIQELSLKRQTLQRNTLLIGILALALYAVLIARAYRQNVRINALLAGKNQEVEQANQALEQANDQVNEKHAALQDAFLQLEHLARTDPLTGLSNRRDFWEKAQAQVRHYAEESRPFAVVLGDLDRFKEVNDQFGHDAGDFVLCRVSEILRQRLRPSDLTARWGGEEFIALLPGADQEEASHVSNRLRTAVRNDSFDFSGQPIPVTITLGVSIYRGGDLAECIKKADLALYQGKTSSRDCVVFSD